MSLMKYFLFPESPYLVNRWWHRLATVMFWAWAAFTVAYFYNENVLKPHDACVAVRVHMQDVLPDANPLDCGTNAFNYLASKMYDSGTARAVADTVGLALLLYIALTLPGVLYRLLLYIGKGKSWRDAPAAS